ncbi:hypothetical protein N7G274_005827 [Stereocaulon virgatum]|uniref:Rhodopsin domain-containing protein n=1 Tax=Stereocaulon virgatum TaxID=373712 RepID=A0ABR4A8K9_9LECA
MACYRYISIPNLVTDVVILILPLHVVWHLHAGVAQKIGLTVTFMTGCIGIVTAALRLNSYLQIDIFTDLTYLAVEINFWAMVEPGVYFIAATLPSLHPLLRHVFKDLEISTLSIRLRNYYTRAFSPQRKTGDTPPTGMHGGLGKPNFTTKTVGSSSTRSTGFRKLDKHKEQLNLPSLEDERELKTPHAHRQSYEVEEDGNRLWLPNSFGVDSGSGE